MSADAAPEPSRIERILAFMAVGILLLSVISMIIVMIGGANHWPATIFMSILISTAYIGLPVAVLLLISLVIIGIVRRRRRA